MKILSGDQIRAMGLNIETVVALLQLGSHITHDQLAPAAVDTTKIKNLAITDAKVNDLTANKITTGTLQASVSITIGGTFNTGVAGAANVKIDPTGIRGYDATNTQRFALLTTGAGWLGNSTDFSWTAAGAVHITSAAIDSLSVSKLTTGNLTAIGTITTGSLVTGAAGTNRIEITSSSISGIDSSNVTQFSLSASNGKATAGAGNVILDASGLTVKGQYLIMANASGNTRGYMYVSTAPSDLLNIAAANCPMIITNTTSDTITINAGTTLTLAANSGASTVYLNGDVIDVTTAKIVNVTDPTNDQDAATKKYVDDNIPSLFTTQTVTSNALDTVYQNTGSTPKLVTISVALEVQDAVGAVSGSSYVTAYSDSSNPPTTGVGALDNYVVSGTTGDFIVYYALTFVVLAGNYYKVTKGKAGDGADAALQYWTEWS